MQIKTDTGMDFTVNGAAFAAVSLFMGNKVDNSVRPYLWGVCVEPLEDGGAVLVATNGHILAAYHDATATAAEAVTIWLDKPLKEAAHALNADAIGLPFPDWRKVMASDAPEKPKTRKGKKAAEQISWASLPPGLVSADSQYLALFTKAAKLLGVGPAVTISGHEGQTKLSVSLADPCFSATLMAYRAGWQHVARPAFIDAKQKSTEA